MQKKEIYELLNIKIIDILSDLKSSYNNLKLFQKNISDGISINSQMILKDDYILIMKKLEQKINLIENFIIPEIERKKNEI